ncbi:MAG: hypothetical protein DHS20C16_15490 [Phycisphaerae bacterium]|nr:MAG: hypothetical protein DHS20C16_15490 [Phycisphaerae bacterium]
MGSEIKSGIGILAAILAFTLIPLGIGGGLLYLRHAALRDTELAKSWVETPCEIETCEWTSSGSDDGPSLDLVYRYQVDGKEYRNDRIDLLIGSMGDDDIMERRIYKDFPKGATAVCYVDPTDPQNSVFDREHAANATWRLWMLAFPFVCTGIGFGLMMLRVGVVALFENRTKETSGIPNHVTGNKEPPRSIPWHTQIAVLAGATGMQVAWLFVVAFFFVFIMLDGPGCWARLFDVIPTDLTVQGKITDVIDADAEEFGITVYQNLVEYEVDGQKYSGDSFTRGRRHSVGDVVEVNCDSDDPANGSIGGARPSEFSWWHSSIPLGVLVLLLFGLGCMYKQNIRALWLMRVGKLATARRLQGMTASEQIEESHASQASQFYFEHDQGYIQAKWYSPPNQKKKKWQRANESVRVLYHPNQPKNNVILDDELTGVTAGTRNAVDNLMHSYAAPMGILAIAILLYNLY